MRLRTEHVFNGSPGQVTALLTDPEFYETLALPDVRERIDLYRSHEEPCALQIRRCATVHRNLAVLDLRDENVIFAGNRFLIYAIFPECDVSMHVIRGRENRNTVFAVGKSILNRGSALKIGELMLQYGGGGHDAAGTCQIENEAAEKIKAELIDILTAPVNAGVPVFA